MTEKKSGKQTMVIKFHFISFRVSNDVQLYIFSHLYCKDIEWKCASIDFPIGLVYVGHK